MRKLLAIAVLCVVPFLSGCLDGQVLTGFREYFPAADIRKYNPAVLHVETHVGNISPQFIVQTWNRFQTTPEYRKMQNWLWLDGYRFMVLGFDDRNVVWDLRRPDALVMDAPAFVQWYVYTFGAPPSGERIIR